MSTVESIAIASASGAPTSSVDAVQVITGRGIEGDRIDRESGERVPSKRQLTLIESEALEALKRESGIDLTAAESRRNICTRGVALNHLVEREFGVGSVRLRGVELCEPCRTLERLAGKKGLIQGLLHRGGLRAEVLEGGEIRVGDAVRTPAP